MIVVGVTVSSVLDSASEHRDLDVVELWSGVEAVVSAAKADGITAMLFDKFRTPSVTDTDDPDTNEDMWLEAGFRRALSLALRLRLGGLLWMAPVCSSWIFLNLRIFLRVDKNFIMIFSNVFVNIFVNINGFLVEDIFFTIMTL